MPKHSLGAIALIAAFLPGLPAQDKPTMTEQQKRGHETFINAKKGTACATCHRLAGEGTAIGPDLTNIAGNATPAGVRVAILSTQTVYVQSVKLTNGSTFPAMPGKEAGSNIEFYDLSKIPPVQRTVKKSDVYSSTNNAEWKHPPESVGYTDSELADIIAYLRYAAKGDTSTVRLGQ